MALVRSYKFRLYPTQHQKESLVETLDGCRWVYNYLHKSNASVYDMQFILTELKEQHEWLYNYYSKMLQMVVHKINAARKSSSALRKNGHKTGRLHYLMHEEYNSFTYNQSGFRIESNRLWLSKIGGIKIRLHRQPVSIKQVTVVRQAGKWYAIVVCETARRIFNFIDPRRSVGIDVGITKFIHDSDNHVVDNPLFLTRMIGPVRRAHRRMLRRKRGSNSRGKACHMLARLYSIIHNNRQDFLHKLSTEYANRYDVIFLERLRTLNMTKNYRLARYILDSGWRTFKILLDYKAKMIMEVDPAYTSVVCSRCGHAVPKSLAIRTHRCDKCDLVIDRDFNASLNILQRGSVCLPQGLREVTLVETALRSLKQEAQGLRSSSHVY